MVASAVLMMTVMLSGALVLSLNMATTFNSPKAILFWLTGKVKGLNGIVPMV